MAGWLTVVRCNSSVAREHRREAGTSVVEMAFVLPLLLLLVFAIGDFGIAYTRWNSLTNAVREGARAGVVFRNPCDAAAISSEIQNTVATFAASSGLDGPSINTTVTNACGGTGTQLTVTATAPYDYVAMAALAGLAPTVNLSARTVMRNE
jgi:Flp pilus assembly protein TadG